MAADKTPVALKEVRAWLRQRGHAVGSRGHLPESLIAEYNRRHRTKVATTSNPMVTGRNQERRELSS